MQDSSLLDKLPVFTTPHQQITFYADDPSSYQQSLSIINPYDFFVRFKVLVSPDTSRYLVSNSSGNIKPHHTVTITLQHMAINPSNIGLTDKIRVLMYNTIDRTRVSGKRDLTVVLLDSAPKERQRSHEVDRFQQLEASSAVQGQLRQQPLPVPIVQEQRSYNSIFCLIALILCLIVHAMPEEERSNNKVLYIAAIILGTLVLAMPKEGDINEYFPNILPRPTSEMKQMACFLLGILCTLLFQS